jgi:hypothetical protein
MTLPTVADPCQIGLSNMATVLVRTEPLSPAMRSALYSSLRESLPLGTLSIVDDLPIGYMPVVKASGGEHWGQSSEILRAHVLSVVGKLRLGGK